VPVFLAWQYSGASECNRAGCDPLTGLDAKRAGRRAPDYYVHYTNVDRDQIIQALRETGGLVGGPNGAASRLGLKRTTFITRMKKLGILPDATSKSREVGATASQGDGSSVTRPS
jgi:hypothetical protein